MAVINDQIIRKYAQKHYADLRRKEALMGDGKHMSIIDVARAMLEDGTIQQADFDKYKYALEKAPEFLKTGTDAYLDKIEQEIMLLPGWSVQKGNADKNPYLLNQDVSAQQKQAFIEFKQKLEEAHKAFDAQMAYDGFFEDMADVFGRMGRKRNYASAVRKDLAKADRNLKDLEDAMKLGYNEFCAAFKKTFGRDYNYQAIKNLKTVEDLYLAAFPAKYQEESFNNKFKELLSKRGLQQRIMTVTDPQTNAPIVIVTDTKEQVYEENFKNLARVFQEQINQNNTKYSIEKLKQYRKWLELEANAPEFQNEFTKKYIKNSKKSDAQEQIARIDNAIRALEATDGTLLQNTQVLKESLQGMLAMSKDPKEYASLKELVDTLGAQVEILECGSGKEYLGKMIKAAGKQNGTLDEKFAVLSDIAKSVSKRMHNQTVEAGGGQEFSQLQRTYDNAYKQAYGNNDILKRVKEYNASQIEGGQWAKQATAFVVLTGVAIASMGAATPVVATAAGGTAAGGTTVATAMALGKGAAMMAGYTFGSNMLEELTRGTNTDVLKKEGIGAYIKSVGKNTQWGNVAVETLTSGAMAVVIGGVLCEVSNLCVVSGMSKLATSSAVGGTMFTVGEGQELMMTGKLTWKGAVFNALIAFSAGALHFINMTKVENAVKAEQARVQLENEVQDARETLGISDRTEITKDLLSRLRREIAQLHSDKTGGTCDVEFSVRWSAYEKLVEGFNSGITHAMLRTYSQQVNAQPLGLPEKINTMEQPAAIVQHPETAALSAQEQPIVQIPIQIKPTTHTETPASIPEPIVAETEIAVPAAGETPLVLNLTPKQRYVPPTVRKIEDFSLYDQSSAIAAGDDPGYYGLNRMAKTFFDRIKDYFSSSKADYASKESLELALEYNYLVQQGKSEIAAEIETILRARGLSPEADGTFNPATVYKSSQRVASAQNTVDTQNSSTASLMKSVDRTVSSKGSQLHERIVTGEFPSLKGKSFDEVKAVYEQYEAEHSGEVVLVQRTPGSIELKDAITGAVVREAHEGFFDGRWYDHHQVFNDKNQITNRFVVDENGRLQSTVEYFYDKDGNQISIGYGGSAGTDVVVYVNNQRQCSYTIEEFVKEYGFKPTYYDEINNPMAPAVSQNPILRTPTSSSSPEYIDMLEIAPRWNKGDFQAWADAHGARIEYDSKSAITTVAKFYDKQSGKLIRRVSQGVENPLNVYDDRRYFWEGDKKTGDILLSNYAPPEYHDFQSGHTRFVLGKNGLWYKLEGMDPFVDENILEINPVTREKQNIPVAVQKAPETKAELQLSKKQIKEIQDNIYQILKRFGSEKYEDIVLKNFDYTKAEELMPYLEKVAKGFRWDFRFVYVIKNGYFSTEEGIDALKYVMHHFETTSTGNTIPKANRILYQLSVEEANNIRSRAIPTDIDLSDVIDLAQMSEEDFLRWQSSPYKDKLVYVSDNNEINEILIQIKEYKGKYYSLDIEESKSIEKFIKDEFSSSSNKTETIKMVRRMAVDFKKDFARKVRNQELLSAYKKAYQYLQEHGMEDARIEILNPQERNVYDAGNVNGIWSWGEKVPDNWNIAVFDKQGNFLRVNRAKQNTGSVKEEVVTSGLSRRKFRAITKPVKESSIIVTSREEFIGDDGKLMYVESYEQSKDIPNKYDIWREYPDGRKYKIGMAEVSEAGDKIIEKNITHQNGSVTDYHYVESPDGSRMTYVKLTAPDGKVVEQRYQYKVIDDNHFKTIENGVEYDIQYKNGKVVVKRSDGESVTIRIGANDASFGLFTRVLSKDLIPLLKKMPGSFYFDIDQYDLRKIGREINNVASDNAHYDDSKNIIAISKEWDSSIFTLVHEFGHYIDKYLQISTNPEIVKSFTKEVATFQVNEANYVANSMRYLIDLYCRRTENATGSISEMVADTHALMYSSNTDPKIELRSQFLQEYFPETFAKIVAAIKSHNP